MIRFEYKIPHGENIIYGKLYRPAREGKFPAIVISHGYNGVGRCFKRECEFFAKNGFVAYAFDFCGGSVFSRSTGKSTDMTIFTEKENLLRVFDEISRLPFVDENNVFLFGASQGGLVSALAAEELKGKVRALALYYPALCIPDNWRENYPEQSDIPEKTPFWGMTLGRKFFESIRNFFVFDHLGSYAGRVLVLHGDEDAIVPLSYSNRLKETYDACELVVLENEGHGFTAKGGKRAVERVLQFLNEQKNQKNEI